MEPFVQLDLSGIHEARPSQEVNKRDYVGNHTLNTDPSERGLFNELLNQKSARTINESKDAKITSGGSDNPNISDIFKNAAGTPEDDPEPDINDNNIHLFLGQYLNKEVVRKKEM